VSQRRTSRGGSPRSGAPAYIAVVDDEASVRRAVQRLLRAWGFWVTSFSSAEAFLARDPPVPPDCLVLDVWMDGMTGLDLQATLTARGEPIPIILITAHDDPLTRQRGLQGGAIAYLTKPFDDMVLLGAIRRALGLTPANESEANPSPESQGPSAAS
jgi:FixJ family two-component response regulator